MIKTTKSKLNNIKGIVIHESIGYVFPKNAGITPGTGGFGPFVVPLKDF